MSDLFWLTDEQMERLRPFFPKSHGKPRVEGDMGIFMRMMDGLSTAKAEPQTIMIDATYLKAHRTASSLRLKKGIQAA